jgi:glutathione synthase/RimK-type ligase-like ATP-grasp enzyme
MEDENKGFVIHEINSNVEFRGASQVSQVDIANAIIEYVLTVYKK